MKPTTLYEIISNIQGISEKELRKAITSKPSIDNMFESTDEYTKEYQKYADFAYKILYYIKESYNKNGFNGKHNKNGERYLWQDFDTKTEHTIKQIIKILNEEQTKNILADEFAIDNGNFSAKTKHLFTQEEKEIIANNDIDKTYSEEYIFKIWHLSLKEYKKKYVRQENDKCLRLIKNFLCDQYPKLAEENKLTKEGSGHPYRDKSETKEALIRFKKAFPFLENIPCFNSDNER